MTPSFRKYSFLASVLVVPYTFIPSDTASCEAAVPTPPAAACIKATSFFRHLAISNIAIHAVNQLAGKVVASSNENFLGIGQSESSCRDVSSAYVPVLPTTTTLSPTLCLVTL